MLSSGDGTELGLLKLIEAHKAPHRHYDATRQRGGIFYDEPGKCWIVTDHVAVRQILGDVRFGSEQRAAPAVAPRAATSFVQAAVEKQIIFTDGERHRRVQQ